MGLNLKSSTVQKYVKAAAKLYTDRKREDPYEPECTILKENFPKILINALEKYEDMPDRKESVTDSMFQFIIDLAKNEPPDSQLSALRDWFVWSRYGGPRRAEWCQTAKSKYQRIPEGEDAEGEALAFLLADVCAFDKYGRHLDMRKAKLSQVDSMSVKWRYQKNGNNGEVITYYRDYDNQDWCAVVALWNIVQRAIRLNIPVEEPIAKYLDAKGRCYFLTDYQVTALLRRAARKVLDITDASILSKWSSHSLRVTAANELHRMNFSEAFIKKRLRWKSDAFLVYLRNTIHIARNHTMGLSKTAIRVTSKEKKEVANVFRIPSDDDALWDINIAQ